MELWRYCCPKHCRDMLLSFELIKKTDWSEDQVISCLYAVSNHTDQHYHKVTIQKKSGGVRNLLVPDEILKTIQRNLLHHVLEGLSISSSAKAYHKGANIVDNAFPHQGRGLVLKLDIEDFFGSITFPMVYINAFPGAYFPPQMRTMLTELCCCYDSLPQGAPTSPAISNLVMRPFDYYMEEWCERRGITYTRYCDDMTFSGSFHPDSVIKKVSGFLFAMGFNLKKEKTRILYRNTRQTVTGIVVNEKLQPPKEYRRMLRQEIYYCLKYGVKSHIERTGHGKKRGEEEYLRVLIGKVRFVLLVNPQALWFKKAEKELSVLLKNGKRLVSPENKQ